MRVCAGPPCASQRDRQPGQDKGGARVFKAFKAHRRPTAHFKTVVSEVRLEKLMEPLSFSLSLERLSVNASNDPRQSISRRTERDDLSFTQIARAGVMVFGLVVALTGILLLVTLFSAVYGSVFSDAGGLKDIFQQWRDIIIPEGVDGSRYDTVFPVTTVLTLAAMTGPVLFLTWLATKVLYIGVKVASLKDK
jgi:hypothetical protein